VKTTSSRSLAAGELFESQRHFNRQHGSSARVLSLGKPRNINKRKSRLACNARGIFMSVEMAVGEKIYNNDNGGIMVLRWGNHFQKKNGTLPSLKRKKNCFSKHYYNNYKYSTFNFKNYKTGFH
jgi:hypothetical protein